MNQVFTGKIILFGEYSIITGSEAVVMPLPIFTGKLKFPEGIPSDEREAINSNSELQDILKFLACQQNQGKLSGKIDIGRLGIDIEKGIYFESNIPLQYGVGSSAALVAAIYYEYADNKISRETKSKKELNHLKEVFSQMESHFHGISSGIDPLCSYLSRNILIGNEGISPINFAPLPGKTKMFLIDSGLKADTGSLVSDFKSRINTEEDFKLSVSAKLSTYVSRGINCLINGTSGEFKEVFTGLSRWQFENFSDMIPGPIKVVWEKGLSTKAYSVKLCGSGGGGFFLGYSDEWENLPDVLEQSGLNFLPLDL